MSFRDRLIASLQAAQDVLNVPGVMVAGSQVPNLLQPDADSTLVVSDDVDIVVPISAHSQVKERLTGLRGYRQASDEPSVWIPDDAEKLEINFIRDDQRRTVRANLELLSLLRPLPNMPDPTEAREVLSSLIRRLEAIP